MISRWSRRPWCPCTNRQSEPSTWNYHDHDDCDVCTCREFASGSIEIVREREHDDTCMRVYTHEIAFACISMYDTCVDLRAWRTKESMQANIGSSTREEAASKNWSKTILKLVTGVEERKKKQTAYGKNKAKQVGSAKNILVLLD